MHKQCKTVVLYQNKLIFNSHFYTNFRALISNKWQTILSYLMWSFTSQQVKHLKHLKGTTQHPNIPSHLLLQIEFQVHKRHPVTGWSRSHRILLKTESNLRFQAINKPGGTYKSYFELLWYLPPHWLTFRVVTYAVEETASNCVYFYVWVLRWFPNFNSRSSVYPLGSIYMTLYFSFSIFPHLVSKLAAFFLWNKQTKNA